MSIEPAGVFEQLSFEGELAEIKPYYMVNQSNALINSRQDLTLTERRIIFSLISLVQPEDEELKTYILPISDLADLVGITDKSFYKRVEKTVESIQSKKLVIETRDKKGKIISIDHISWIQQATYLKGEGLVRIKLSDALAKYLANLASFTKYQLFNVLQLRSDYSWRMYELLKEKEPLQKKRIIRIAELRHLLNIPDDKLKETKNFKKVVLERAKKELKEKTDIYFDYEVHKKVGRNIDSFIFYIHRNESNIRKYQTKDSVNFDVRNLLNRLLRYGVNRTIAASLIKEFHPRYIDENLQYALKMRQGDSNISNISGYIVKAIQNNYADSNYQYIENDYESSLYSIAAGDYVQKVKERNEEDISRIKDLIEHYKQATFKAGENNDYDSIQSLGQLRTEQLNYLLNDILGSRQKYGFPFLTEAEFQDDKTLIPYFLEWKRQRELKFDAALDIPAKQNDDDDDDLPY